MCIQSATFIFVLLQPVSFSFFEDIILYLISVMATNYFASSFTDLPV